jgi:twitching motility two-component system response regulator PilG
MRLEFEPNVTAIPLVENELFDDEPAPRPPEFEILLKKGIAAAQSGEREVARALLGHCAEMEPRSEDAWMWLASVSDYPEELLAFLQNVLQINPANERAVEWYAATTSLLAKTFVQRGIDAHNQGSDDLAAQCFERALEHDERCEMAWFWKASIASADEEKLECLEQVLEIDPENLDAKKAIEGIRVAAMNTAMDTARKAAAAGDHANAVNVLDEALATQPSYADAWMLRSELVPELKEKLASLEKVLEIDPENQDARQAIDTVKLTAIKDAMDTARNAAAAGDHANAVSVLDNALADLPSNADAWILRSHLAVDINEKLASLKKALEIDPNNMLARSSYDFLSVTGQVEQSGVKSVDTDQNVELSTTDDNPYEDISVEAPMADEASETAATDDPTYFQMVVPQSQDGETQMEAPDSVVTESPTVAETSSDDLTVDRYPAYFETIRPQAESPETSETTNGHVSGDTEQQHAQAHDDTPDEDIHITDESFIAEPFDTAPAEYSEVTPEAPVLFETTEPELSQEPVVEKAAETKVAAGPPCPYCGSNVGQSAFQCDSCHAVLSLSDIEGLLSGNNVNVDAIKDAVANLETACNFGQPGEAELTTLAIGHFNLRNFDQGYKYLVDASRIDPNNVILAGQTNAIAIRLDEMRWKQENSNPLAGKSILVVDDSATVRKLISAKLEKSGHNVICAADGVDGLQRISESIPDLVLLDITMPRMDGYEVCREIRANPAAKDIPVVMISGKDGFFDKVRGKMAGATGYVTKPFGPETLMKALDTYLNRENNGY